MNSSHRCRALFLVIGFALSSIVFAEHGGGGYHQGNTGGYHQGNTGGYHQGNTGGYHQGNTGGYHQGNTGGYHQGIYNQYDGYHHNYDNNYYSGYSIGNYYPSGGWVAPTVVIDPSVNTTVDESDCQTIQQCNDDGTCILTQDCY
ncbi:hypothetical protein [Legionella fallonii]|uniref:Uncharacterized protein n=1 Tax=Legionella fallonii LLAP-10 TaxID=1212491 RepID=A0A098G671_9GAMM|nr:hypothetical protein [Legionella fallonii]CEG57998.1 exported protein of unknown function [Legionella fallonii LLAP-10]